MCISCPAGSFRADAAHYEAQCQKWAPACSGQRYQQEAPSATTDRTCATNADCAAYEYIVSDGEGEQRVCKAKTICQPGHFIFVPGNDRADNECRTCNQFAVTMGNKMHKFYQPKEDQVGVVAAFLSTPPPSLSLSLLLLLLLLLALSFCFSVSVSRSRSRLPRLGTG